MPFRRRSKKTSTKSRARSAAIQALESRMMLTAVVHGLFTNTNTVYDGTNTFIYRQGNGDAQIKISVFGDITAEFIGARAVQNGEIATIQDANADVVLTDLLPDTAPAFIPATATTPAQFPSTFLFQIYIVSSNANCGISIAQVPNRPIPPAVPIARPMQPFVAGVTTRIFNATTGASETIQLADGGVYIGSQSLSTDAAPANNIPRIFANRTSFGMRPSAAGQIFAGILTADNVDIGKVLIGGTVTGNVNFRGNVGLFYAGNILTGDASGISATGNQSDLNGFNIGHFARNNFHVEGDIRSLLTANSFGTVNMNTLDGAAVAGDLTSQQYKTGFQLLVDGRAGGVFANNSFLGEATVRNLVTEIGFGSAQREVEFVGPTITNTVFGGNPDNASDSYFDVDFHGLDASVGGTTPDARFLNNTLDSPQFLGTFRSVDLNSSDVIQLKGSLLNLPAAGTGVASPDPIDYYAVGLLAGQIVDFKLTDSYGTLQTTAHAHLGIFDPRGRLIASDYTNLGEFARVNQSIRIKADIPGIYRIGIAHHGDYNFNGIRDAAIERQTVFTGVNPYELRITNVGNIGLGGLTTNQHIATMDVNSAGIQVLRGDVGSIRAGMGPTLDGRAVAPVQGSGQIFSESNPWYVPAGHFRDMEAFSFGISGAVVLLGTGPDLLIRKGSIGFLRTSGLALNSTLALNDDLFLTDGVTRVFPSPSDDLSLVSRTLAVGMDIQVVDAGGVLMGSFLANRGIGTIRAQQLGGLEFTVAGAGTTNIGAIVQNNGINTSPVIMTNVDTIGSDGVIDLIDVSLNTAAVSVYGVAISTGPNGNLRYFHVGTTALVRSDPDFGGGDPQITAALPGEQVRLTDDSGASVVLTPIPLVRNTLFPRPTNALSDFLDPPQLTVLTYPVRGKSGVAILRVTVAQVDDTGSDGTTNINRLGGGGMQVDASSNGARSSAEIGEINLSSTPGASTSNPITFDPFDRVYIPTVLPTDPTLVIRPLDLIFRGGVPIDVYGIIALAAQTINSIDNQTTGEMLNISGGVTGVVVAAGPDIVSFSAQQIGIAKSTTGAAVEGATQQVVNVLPFTDTRNLINVGDIGLIRARGAIGNIQATNIGTLQANYDGRNTTGRFEGIAAPIAVRSAGANQLIGNLVQVDIGEGVSTSGSGGAPVLAAAGNTSVTGLMRGGIYVDGIIDSIRGRGDIRGDIIATGTTTFVQQQDSDVNGNLLINPDGTPLLENTPRYIIGSIRLTGGSIIDADILTTPIVQGIEGYDSGSTGYTALELGVIPAESLSKPAFDIGSIRLDGLGGIIGSFIFAADVGQISVNGGFGVVTSEVLTVGNGVIQGITTDGYGVRDTQVLGGIQVNAIIARGTGARVATTSYSASVRQSEVAKYDAQSGEALDPFNDLHQALGTSSRRPAVVGVSETGLIVDSQFLGGRDLGTVQAFRIIGRDVLELDSRGRNVRIPFGRSDYPMKINFANSIGNIITTDVMDGLSLTTSKLKNFTAGNDVSWTELNVGSTLDNLYVGAWRGTSALKMTTSGGTLKSFRTRRSLFGSINVSQDVLNLTVGTDIGSPLIHVGRNLKNLTVKGSALTGADITVKKTLTNLVIGGDVRQGATIRAAAIQNQKIGGQILGDILIV